MEDNFKSNLVICNCGDVSHQLIISTFEFKNSKAEDRIDCFIQVHLTKFGFFERIKHAIKYIFGFQCKFGAFDEIVIDENNAQKIKESMEYYLLKSKKS